MKKDQDAIDAGLAKLKSELHRDDKLFPADEYTRNVAFLQEWCAKIRGLMVGGLEWYEQGDKIRDVLKWLARINQAFDFFGSMPTADVQVVIAAYQQQIVSILMLEGPLPKSIYPQASNGHQFRSCLEMRHAFFNLGKNQIIQIKNNGDRDTQYHADGFYPARDPRARYRIPAGGGWTPIPPFIPRPGDDTGAFITADEIFKNRFMLEIRIVSKSESQPPICMLDEGAAAEVKRQAKAAEISSLLETIKSGGSKNVVQEI